MKRIVSTLLIVVLLIGLMPTIAFAAITGTSGELTWRLDGRVLTISGTGKMDDYGTWDNFDAPWGKSIKEVIIENGVTSIGNSAFYQCSSLTSITVPDSVTSIGDSAFYYCESLKSITIPDSVTSIGDSAFCHCNSLESITIPDSVTSVGKSAFFFCEYLKSVDISNSLTSISNYMFSWCKSLISITIPDGVTSIGESAFAHCGWLTSINIPNSVTSIGDSAFSACNDLTDVYINDLNSWCNIDFSSWNASPLCNDANVYINGILATNISIPDSVINIGNYTFYRWRDLSNVNIHNRVTSIGNGAFAGCLSLTAITIPDSVTSIGNDAFASCLKLTAITIPDSVTSIGDSAFSDCDNLKKVALSNQMTKIAQNTFSCRALKVVYIPKSITLIENGAFEYDDGRTNIDVVDYVFYGGSEADRENLINSSNNDSLNAATWIYNVTGLPECEYDNNCDAECNICTISRVPNHEYDNVCDTTCDECGYERITTHIYSNACDAECNICHTIRSVGPHQYNNACDKDCNICGDTRTVSDHVYTNNCDTTCNECRVTRTIQHTYTNDCDTSCNICGVTRYITHTFGAYVYNEDATSTTDGTKTRTCSVCGHPETATAPGTKWTNPFTDVPRGQYYTDPVLWAVSKGITTGTSATTFSPDAACTRGQIVTFLWRAAGSPAPKSSRNPFVDVPSNQYYYKAVLWAVEKGITTGMDATHFAPDASCTRGQIVTFLWRAKDKPAASSSNPFYDVSTNAYYYSPVLWAVKNGITTGMSATSFAPDAPCTRAQIVTFLYRAYK